MRFVVFGAGAVGGVVGARLAQHGHDVVLVARGRHLDAIRAGGLRLDAPDGSMGMGTAVPVDVDGAKRTPWRARPSGRIERWTIAARSSWRPAWTTSAPRRSGRGASS